MIQRLPSCDQTPCPLCGSGPFERCWIKEFDRPYMEQGRTAYHAERRLLAAQSDVHTCTSRVVVKKRSTERNVPVEIEAEVKSFEVTVNLAAKSAGFEQAILYA